MTGSHLTDRKRGLREGADARREEHCAEGKGAEGDARSRGRAARLPSEAERRTLSGRWASESPSPAELRRDPAPHAPREPNRRDSCHRGTPVGRLGL